MKILIIAFIFFIFCSLIIINNHDLKIFHKQDFQKFSGFSKVWFKDVFFNTKSITANVIKSDWIPK